MNRTLLRGLTLAINWHMGQVDKVGEPYINHVLRVVQILNDQGWSDSVLTVGALHDTIEDTEQGQECVRSGEFARLFPPVICSAVLALTHHDDESYEQYIDRVSLFAFARIVKRADIQDNMSPKRLERLDETTQERLRRKYTAALIKLNRIK